MKSNQRLSESRQIELATMVEFMQDDVEFLDELQSEAGNGFDGDYEAYNLRMASYWLNGARKYVESIVDGWMARDGAEIAEADEMVDTPITVVTGDTVTRYTPEKTTTTYVDKVTGKSGVATVESSAPEKQLALAPTPKTDKSVAKWSPAHKDEDKIKKEIRKIMEDTPEWDWNRVGFKGWLSASVTASLGGKPDVKLVLDMIQEVMNEPA